MREAASIITMNAGAILVLRLREAETPGLVKVRVLYLINFNANSLTFSGIFRKPVTSGVFIN